MWIRTSHGLFQTDYIVCLKVLLEGEKWCLKYPSEPGHPTIKAYDTEQECLKVYNEIADELEKVKPKKVMRI